ncbi:SDR family oxidoreductase [Streptomyces sp. NPDC004752]
MNQTAVIIGAAQGIGEAVARRLAADRPVVLADLRHEAVKELAADLTAHGADARAEHVDITRPESVAELVRATSAASQVAISAGLFHTGPALTVTSEAMADILDVNLIGVYSVARAYAQAMADGHGGAICAVGSIAARVPRLRQAAYCASKAGMRQALRVLGLEVLPHGVRVNFVAPGPTDTPMMATLAQDHSGIELWRGDPDAFRPRIPDQRVATPEDIADATAFLLSDAAAHIALHDLYVDGGESLGL